MEEQLNPQRALCITCLSTDRNLHSIKMMRNVYQILNLLVQTEHYEMCNRELLLCWECLALVHRFDRFKTKAQLAQQYLYGFNDGVVKIEDPLALPTSLSTLICTKTDCKDISGDLSKNSQTLIPNEHKPIIVKEEEMDISDISVHSGPNMGQHSKPTYVKDSTVNNYILIDIPAKPIYSSQAILSQESDQKSSHAKVTVRAGLSNYTMKSDEIKSLYTKKLKRNAENKTEKAAEPKKKVLFTLGSVTELKKRLEMKPAIVPTLDLEIKPNCSNTSDTIQDGSETDTGSSDGYEEVNEFEPKESMEPEPVYNGDIYPCNECGKLCKSKMGRRSHIQNRHTENVQCDYCKKTFVSKTSLIRHIRTQQSSQGSQNIIIETGHHQDQLNTRHTINVIMKHQGPLPKEECPICHQMIVSMLLKIHIRAKHTEKKKYLYTCDKCNKFFFSKTGFNDHMKYTKAHRKPENYPFPCTKCDRGFVSEIDLEDHVNYIHLGQTKHKCNICGKPYCSKITLLRHIRTHENKATVVKPRDQVCHKCGKAFYCKKILSNHMKTHSDERSYKCDICQDTFKQNGALYTHKKLKHKVTAIKQNIKIIEADG